MGRPREDATKRFWEYVQKGTPQSCWVWTGNTDRGGYGIFSGSEQKNVKAHRFAYQMLVNSIPSGAVITHSCASRNCVNPAHLVTASRPTIHPAAKIEDRFWQHVKKTGSCWLWIGKRHTGGYGLLWTRTGWLFAHRVSYEIHYGPLLPGICVLHRCDNPPCVNPEHLFIGTISDNNLDMSVKWRTKSHLGRTQILDIRYRYATRQITQRELAKEFRLDQSSVSDIITRKTFRHI